MQQGKKTSSTYISWDKALERLNCTGRELYEKCNSGDLPVYSSNLVVRYHPSSHFYMKKQYIEPDTLHWCVEQDTQYGEYINKVLIRHCIRENIGYNIQKLSQDILATFFELYVPKDTVAPDIQIDSVLGSPKTAETNFGKITITCRGGNKIYQTPF